MNSRNPSLPTTGKIRHKVAKGSRVTVTSTAGPKLGGKSGLVVGTGATSSQLRVLLDGSKHSITLHSSFVEPAGSGLAATARE